MTSSIETDSCDVDHYMVVALSSTAPATRTMSWTEPSRNFREIGFQSLALWIFGKGVVVCALKEKRESDHGKR